MLKLVSLKFNQELFENSILSFLTYEESDEFIIIALVNSFNKIFFGIKKKKLLFIYFCFLEFKDDVENSWITLELIHKILD